MASLEEVRQERIEKLKAFRLAGGEAYPIEAKVTHCLAEVAQDFSSLAKAKKLLTVAGRVMGKRGQGAISFLDLDDGTARLQTFFSQENFKAKDWQRFSETVDLGDFIEVRGELFLTKQKAQTIAAKDWRLLTKSLRPLPDKWHGLENVEERFRRRYLDTLVNPEVKARFILRSRLISALRAGLEAADYMEVETPILQPLAGGASAFPFRTHHEALDLDLYLRISPELYLKQMLVGGFTRVYEFARDFRNEGIDVTHHPEFTVLEFYEAYSDAKKQMIFVERLLRGVIKALKLKQPFTYNDVMIDFRPKFKVVSYFDLLKKYALISDPAKMPLADLTLKANQLAVLVESGASREKILDAIYKKVCRPKLIAPTFIIDYPRDYLPLAKAKPEQPELADAFQLVVGGLELVKAFSELNDPLDQAERFRIQDERRAAGDAEAQPNDQHFIEALEYGLPPAGGVGVGIDRLVMLLTDATNIREVIYFPTLRPKASSSPKEALATNGEVPVE